MLTIVEGETVSFDRRRQPSKVRTPFEKSDLKATIGEGECGGNSGETSADHTDARRLHERARARLLIATDTFSRVGTETRPCVTATGLLSIRMSKRQ